MNRPLSSPVTSIDQCCTLDDIRQLRHITSATIKRERTALAESVRKMLSPFIPHSSLPAGNEANEGFASPFGSFMGSMADWASGWMGRISLALSLFEGVKWGIRLYRRVRKLFV